MALFTERRTHRSYSPLPAASNFRAFFSTQQKEKEEKNSWMNFLHVKETTATATAFTAVISSANDATRRGDVAVEERERERIMKRLTVTEHSNDLTALCWKAIARSGILLRLSRSHSHERDRGCSIRTRFTPHIITVTCSLRMVAMGKTRWIGSNRVDVRAKRPALETLSAKRVAHFTNELFDDELRYLHRYPFPDGDR